MVLKTYAMGYNSIKIIALLLFGLISFYSCDRPVVQQDDVDLDTVANIPDVFVPGEEEEELAQHFNTRNDKTKVQLEQIRQKAIAKKYGESDELAIKLRNLEEKQMELEKRINELMESPEVPDETINEIDSAISSLERAIEMIETEMNRN